MCRKIKKAQDFTSHALSLTFVNTFAIILTKNLTSVFKRIAVHLNRHKVLALPRNTSDVNVILTHIDSECQYILQQSPYLLGADFFYSAPYSHAYTNKEKHDGTHTLETFLRR